MHFAVDYLTSVTKSLLDSNLPTAGPLIAEGQERAGHRRRRHRQRLRGHGHAPGLHDRGAAGNDAQPPRSVPPDNPWPEWPRVLKTDYGQEECHRQVRQGPPCLPDHGEGIPQGRCRATLTAAVISYLKPERDRETGRTNMVPTGEEFAYNCELAFIAAGFVGCESYVADAFGVSLTGRGCVDTEPLPHQRGQGVCLRRYAPGPEPCRLGPARGPRLRRRGRPLPHGLHQPVSPHPGHY